MHRVGLLLFLAGVGASLVAVACGGGAGEPDAGLMDADPVAGCLDMDGDTISDIHEGAGTVDTDGDSVTDDVDDDADGDTLSDMSEAGDDDPCTAPRDSDGDHIPDFQDTDSDNNGIPDSQESTRDTDGDGVLDVYDDDDDNDGISDATEIGEDPSMPADTDGDGVPDILDSDADGDGIPDAVEGSADWDNDGLPAYADTDSDGDEVPDAIEVGPDPLSPTDADGDGYPDFGDADSDNDGLGDGQEDLDHDGVLDPGESDPTVEDTDGDGFPDVVEWAAGTDPGDSMSVLSADDFFFLLPYLGQSQEDDLDFNTEIVKADVFFQIDTTGSMTGTITTLQNSLQAVIVPSLDATIDDVAMGAGWFRDFPLGGFGGGGDLPFQLVQRITTSVSAVQAGLDTFLASGGSDIPESGMEALYQTVTGEGVNWTTGAVPKFNPFAGYEPALGHGLLPGVGFRHGALPIVVHATDAPFHDGPEYWFEGIPDAHSRTQAVNAAKAMGARFIAIVTAGQDKNPLKSIARETGAVVLPLAWGMGETMCHTGLNGALEMPDPDGLCPLAFTMNFNGSGVDQHVVHGIDALVNFATLDISGVPVSDPAELPLDTARFITGITPVPPAPPGSTINGGVFEDVLPGLPVRFTVHAHNTFVPGAREAQLFRVTIRVMGSTVTVLDERDVFIVIPAVTYIPRSPPLAL